MLDHNYIGTEHLLLGLVHEGNGVASMALESLGVSLQDVRARVEDIIGRGQGRTPGHIPFTPRAKKVLELSLREALQLGHDYIGTEHILLGLIREGEGVCAQVLVALGADLERVRRQVVEVLSAYVAEGGGARPRDELTPEEMVGPARCKACSADLSTNGRFTTVAIPPLEGDEARPFVFLFCGRCGETVSAWPEPPEGSQYPQ